MLWWAILGVLYGLGEFEGKGLFFVASLNPLPLDDSKMEESDGIFGFECFSSIYQNFIRFEGR